MSGALNMAYGVREQISYAFGLAMVLGLALALGFGAESRPPTTPMEFRADLAFLETPKAVVAPEPLAPQPVKPAERQAVATPAIVNPAAAVPQPVVVDSTAVNRLSDSASETAAAAAPPASASPAKLPESSVANELVAAKGAYEATLLAYLERIKRYPSSREARQTRPRGVVRVWLELDRSGRLLGSGVADSSGSNLLDGEALRTIRGGTYPSFPEHEYPGESKHQFTAALSYTID